MYKFFNRTFAFLKAKLYNVFGRRKYDPPFLYNPLLVQKNCCFVAATISEYSVTLIF